MTTSALAGLRDADWLTGPMIRRLGMVAAASLLLLFAAEWWVHLHPAFGSGIVGGLPLGEDFVNYWSGARLAADGQVGTVYNLRAFLDFERTHAAPFDQFRWYAYPPVALVIFQPLALLDYTPAYVAWLIGGTALCAWVLTPAIGWRMALLTVLATPAVFFNAVAGQNGEITAALMAGGVVLLDRRPWLAGLMFGALCYKPQFGVLIPVALLAAWRWRTFLAAGATVVAMTGASLLLYGRGTWAAYLRNAPMNRYILENGRLPDLGLAHEAYLPFWHRMPTMFAAARLAGAGLPLAYALQIVAAIAAVAAVAIAWRRKAPTPVLGAVLVLATLLATPYSWDYDFVALTFAVVWLWRDASTRTGFLPWEKLLLAASLVATLLFGPVSKATHLQIAPLVLWLALAFAVRRSSVVAAPQPSALTSVP